MENLKLDDNCSITINGKPKQFFMSYGLCSELSSVASNEEHLSNVFQIPEYTDQFLGIILSPRDEEGKLTTPDGEYSNARDFAMSKEDSAELLCWAAEHIMDFLLQKAQIGLKLQERLKPKMENLQSSIHGSPTSTSTKGSVGPLTASPQE